MGKLKTKDVAALCTKPKQTILTWVKEQLLEPGGGGHGAGYEWDFAETLRAYILTRMKEPPLKVSAADYERAMSDLAKVDIEELTGKILWISCVGDVHVFKPREVTVVSSAGRGVLVSVDKFRGIYEDHCKKS